MSCWPPSQVIQVIQIIPHSVQSDYSDQSDWSVSELFSTSCHDPLYFVQYSTVAVALVEVTVPKKNQKKIKTKKIQKKIIL